MKMLTLALVIPVYNEEDHIVACLQAVANQTVMPDEVIVVDNNSTDRTVALARQFSFVRVVRARRQGIAHARDAGFNAVRSELIGRIDADTLLGERWVEEVRARYAVNRDFALTGGGYFYNVPLPRFNGWALSQLAYRLNRFIMGHYILWGSNMVIPTSMWRKVRSQVCSERHDIHEDLDLAIHLNQAGVPITYRESLRVGVEMKRVYNTDGKVHKARMNMWPNTLYAHELRRAWMGRAGAWVLYEGRFVVRGGEAVARMYRIGRHGLSLGWLRR